MNKIYKEDVITQIDNEYQLWYDFVSTKRQKIRDRMAMYRNISDQEDKIYDRMIRTIAKTRLAIHYNDKKSVSFMGRQWKVWSNEKAKLIEELAIFDYDEMWSAEKDYRHLEDIALKGVGIRVGWLWDNDTSTPEYMVIDPLCWIPDPYNDINTWPRFHWFELEVWKGQLLDGWFFEIDQIKSKTDLKIERFIKDKVQEWESRVNVENSQEVQAKRELSHKEKNIKGNELYSIYVHYTTVWNKKYMFTLANDRSLLIGEKLLKPVRKEEKKNPRKIPFPVVITNLSPIQDDPFGESFFDILEDKQVARQAFLNLMKTRALHETFWDTYLVDRSAIKNPDQLKQTTQWTKYVRADLTRNPSPIKQVEKPQIKPDSYNMPELLKQQAFMEANLDEGSLWVSWGWGKTATENVRVQKNSNLRMVLDRKMILLWDKKFWDILRYRVYQENFRNGKKKQILISSGLGRVPQAISSDEFNTVWDVRVSIESSFEKKEKEETQRMAFMANVNTFLQSPWSPFAKTYTLRKLATLSGFSEWESFIVSPETYDEMNAKLDVELLNRNEAPSKIEMWQDHETYIVYYEQAYNTDAKAKAIAMRRMAMMEDKRQAMEQGATWAEQNQAMITNQMMQWQQEAPSLSDITANG